MKQRTLLVFFTFLLATTISFSAIGQINPPNQLVTSAPGNVLQFLQSYYGNTGTVSNLTITCDTTNGQLGQYTWGPLMDGLILTSGTAFIANGPNSSTAGTGFIPAHPGDPTLTILAGSTTNDACAVEFDLVPTCNKFKASFAFGSEEYPNFVGFYNDICGIFITGLNPNGPNFVNTNIATIPGTSIPVCVNNVNASNNIPYFYDNQAGGLLAQYDGWGGLMGLPLDTILTVFPGQTYHVKVAVADAGDNSLDSGILFGKGKDSCDLDSTLVIIHDAVGGGNVLVEGCNPGEIIFLLPNAASQDVTYNVSLGGSATLGQDYLASLPSQITIPAGQNMISFPITTVPDITQEGSETIIVFAEQVTSCFGVQAIYPILSASIILNDLPEVIMPPVPPLCSGQAALIGTTILPSYTSVSWSPPVGLSNPNDPTPTVMWNNFTLQPEIHSYVMTLTTAEGCIIPTNVDVVVNPGPTLPMPTIAPTCSGSSVVLGSPAPNYPISWSPSTGLNNPNMDMPTLTLTNTGTSPQTYKYYRTFGIAGCVGMDSVSVDIYPIPTLPMPTVPALCANQSFVLGSQNIYPNTTVLWTPATGLDNPTMDMPTFALPNLTSQAQNYSFNRLLDNGVCSTNVSVNVLVNPIPNSDFTIPVPRTCDFSTSLQASSSSATAQYNWNWGDATSSIGNNASHTYNNTGVQTITLTATDFSNCTSSTTHTYEILVKPIADFTASPACEGQAIAFTNTSILGNSGNMQYEWNFSDGTNPTLTANAVHTYPQSGSYNVSLALTGQYPGCSDAKTTALEIYPNPTASFAADNVCEGLNMSFQNNSTSAEFNPITSYVWNYADGTPTENSFAANHIYSQAGTYPVSLAITTDKGCTDLFTRNVTIYPTPEVPKTNDVRTCLGQDAVLMAIANPSDKVYWYNDMATNNTLHIGNLYAIPQALASDVFYVQTVSNHQCKSERVPVVLTVRGEINALVLPQTPVVELPNALVDFSVNSSEPIVSYVWGFGDKDSSIMANPTHAYQYPGFYDVTVRITDDLGCKYLRTSRVEVKDVYGVFVPSAFSPNGDGFNDVLTVGDWQVANFSFSVYDRWGGEVFHANHSDFSWNGTDMKTGKELPEGVYTYYVEAVYGNGKRLKNGGTVTIVR